MRTIVLSDLHAGRRGSRVMDAGVLRPLLAGFDRIIFNGDATDFCALGFQKAEAYVLQLDAVAREQGREVVWIRGNHDFAVDGVNYLLEDGVLITHGHGYSLIDAAVPATETDNCALDRAFAQRHEQYRRTLDKRRGAPGVLPWLEAFELVIPTAPIGYARAIHRGLPKRLVRFVEHFHLPPVHTFVLGHYHFGTRWQLPDGRRALLTGAWMRNARPYAAVLDAGRVRLHTVLGGQTAGYHLGPETTGSNLPAPVG